MRIDPSVMKQLLQLQMLQGAGSLMGSGTALQSGDSGTEFSELLQMLLGGSTTTEVSNKIIPASELLSRSKAAYSFSFNNPSYAAYAGGNTDYDGLITDSSSRHGVEASLVKAVIQAESGYNSQAVSRAGAKGLMQLMDATGQGLGVSNPFDPQQNIEGGTRFLSNLLKKYNGNEAVALAAYNAGPGRVDRLGIKTDADLQEKLTLLPKETQNYVSKVLSYKQGYML